jgi:hypothetical protein
MKIIENFLPHSLHKIIQQELLGESFPWYFNNSIAYENQSGSNFQFTHTFYRDQNPISNWFNVVQSMMFILETQCNYKLNGILRIKANLNTQNPLLNASDNAHQDSKDPRFMTMLYYVNDSDGDTLFFDDSKTNIINRVTPKENTAVIFKSNLWHASSAPIENKRRVVINFILEVE